MGRLEQGRRCCSKRHKVHTNIIIDVVLGKRRKNGFHTNGMETRNGNTLGSNTRGYRKFTLFTETFYISVFLWNAFQHQHTMGLHI